jgi:hypothetical protein
MTSPPAAESVPVAESSEPREHCVHVKGRDCDFRYGLFDKAAASKEQKRMAKKREADKVTAERWEKPVRKRAVKTSPVV